MASSRPGPGHCELSDHTGTVQGHVVWPAAGQVLVTVSCRQHWNGSGTCGVASSRPGPGHCELLGHTGTFQGQVVWPAAGQVLVTMTCPEIPILVRFDYRKHYGEDGLSCSSG